MAISVTATRKVPLAELRPHARNPRNGDVEAIAASLGAHGQYRPLVVREDTNEILAGNHVYAAACELGWQELLCSFVDCDPDEAARILLVDNRLSELGAVDEGLLVSLLSDLGSLDGTGYDEAALQKLLADAERALELERGGICEACGRAL